MIRTRTATALALFTLSVSGCSTIPSRGWQTLFDGTSLDGWKATDFADPGEIAVVDGGIQVGIGSPFSGITYTRPVPRCDYELEVDATRVEGSDFFAAITFPVEDACCTLVLGGWGGTMVGLSSLDDMDASQNETSSQVEFETGRRYRILVRVSATRIFASIDGKTCVDVETRDRTVGMRWELHPSRPLGIATFRTKARYDQIRIRPWTATAPTNEEPREAVTRRKSG